MRKLIGIMLLATLALLLFWYDRDLRNREQDIKKKDEAGTDSGLDLSEYDDD